MRKDGIFIAVEVEDGPAADAELAARLAEVCPVDIFASDGEGGGDGDGGDGGDGGPQALEIVEKNLDECVLCRLCLDAAPEGTVRVIKLYDDEALL